MLAEASDGSILLTVWVYGGSSVAVIRSTDAGQHYEPAFEEAGTDADDVRWSPILKTASGTATALLSYVSNGDLVAHRSPDDGATFSSATTISRTGDGCIPALLRREGLGRQLGPTRGAAPSTMTTSRRPGTSFFRFSDDDGLSYGPVQRVDSGASGTEWRGNPGLVSTPGEFLVVYPDERGNVPPLDAWSSNIFASRTLESSIAFGPDSRIDTDAGPAPPSSGYKEPAVATDGANHVYVAFNAYSSGPYATIFVAASADGGKTFGTPVAVGASASGQLDSHVPLIAATRDGHVYVVYQADATDSSFRQVRFNSSSDFGQTWQASDTLLGGVPQDVVELFGIAAHGYRARVLPPCRAARYGSPGRTGGSSSFPDPRTAD